jgi:alkylated DNA repair protein alkB homolog 8
MLDNQIALFRQKKMANQTFHKCSKMRYHEFNGGKEHFLFTRPHNQDQTDVLMLSPTFQATEAAILQLFRDFGATKVTSLPPNNSPSFVEFAANETTSSIALAAAAKHRLSGVPCPWNPDRSLLIKFAKRTSPPPPPPQSSLYTGTPPAVLSSEECNIPGLLLIPNFISEDEQTTLLSLIDSTPWEHLAKRKVQHWGKKFKYDIRGVDPNEPAVPFPPQIASIASRIENIPPSTTTITTDTDTPAFLSLCPSPLDQLTVNEYSPGVGLAPHVDTHSAFEGAIVSLSLAGPTVMVLRKEIDVDVEGNGNREEKEKIEEKQGIDHQNHNQNHMQQKSLFLPPRSLLILGREARYAWQHYIPHRKSDEVVGMGAVHRAERRVSLTFRKINTGGPCQCRWPKHCDSQGGGPPPTRLLMSSRKEEEDNDADDGDKDQEQYDTTNDNWVEKMEGGHVQNVYEAIAPHFSATRFAIWPKVKAFIDSLPPGSIVADVGCGNGKYFGVRRDIFVIGSDRSPGLAGVANQRLSVKSIKGGCSMEHKAARLGDLRADVFAADGMHLPFKDGSCDGVLCIAVLHHISSVQRRVQFLEELRRILKPGGRAIITVWVSEQSDQRKFAKWKRLNNNSTNGDTTSSSSSSSNTDYFVPWNIPLYRAEAAAVAAAGTVDRQKNTVVFQRYYHLFNEGELEELIEKQVTGVGLRSSVYDADNWVVEMVREEE